MLINIRKISSQSIQQPVVCFKRERLFFSTSNFVALDSFVMHMCKVVLSSQPAKISQIIFTFIFM